MMQHEWAALSTLNGLVIPINAQYSENAVLQALFESATDVFGVEAVQNESFHCLILLVHQLRGNQQTYVKELIEFGETMVDSKRRRCSHNLYNIAALLPKWAPQVKVCLIKKQYSLKPDEDKRVPSPSERWPSVKQDCLLQLEVMLRYLKQQMAKSAQAADNTSDYNTDEGRRHMARVSAG